MKLLLLLTLVLFNIPNAVADVSKIAFGSCADQDRQQPIWKRVVEEQADVFLFLGDNVYADTADRSEMLAAYEKLGAKPGFKALKASTDIMAIWDDHDFGLNDAGGDFPAKHMAREVFADFWGHGPDSDVRVQDGGIYQSRIVGEAGKRIQIIMLDTRFNRSPITKAPQHIRQHVNRVNGFGPYMPTNNPKDVLIGEAQWRWLEQQLNQPAELRIIASSIQILGEFTGWEAWANFPHERQRLFDLLDKTRANGVVMVSGDVHHGEVSRIDNAIDYPLWEITSSGLATRMYPGSINVHRLEPALVAPHYATIEVDWDKQLLDFKLKGLYGNAPQTYQVNLSRLQFSRP